jgi:hypothetical protein
MALPDLTHEQAKELAGGPFGAETLRNAGRYVVPICWPVSVDRGVIQLRNGTAFFVKTPRKVFAVTAAHVVRGFMEHKAQVPDAVCGLLDSETPIDLERDLIAMGRRVDIATFQVSERAIAKLGKQPITAWPPRTPQVGKGVVYAGFPGMARERTAPREFAFGLVSGATVADSVSETRIISVVDQGDLQDPLGHGLPPSDFEFGGMSGGPMLAVIETGLLSWALAGVITDGGSFLGGMLFADRATCIQDDGTIAE